VIVGFAVWGIWVDDNGGEIFVAVGSDDAGIVWVSA